MISIKNIKRQSISILKPTSGHRSRPRRPINDDTGLRKLMRYARASKLSSERLQVIKRTMESAKRRAHVYFNSSPRKRYGW